jgi:demethylmenaquinone methyltransferase/2-methoxy-6-polyprenyl-1,4-benzoquinol methylase
MFDAIAPTYDMLNTVLSGGFHRRWEAQLVRALPGLPEGRALDLCTGTGALVPKLAARYAEVVGADISPKMLAVAHTRWKTISNAKWLEADAQHLAFEGEMFDVVTVSYGVRNLPDLSAGLAEIRRVLKVGGRVGILEFGTPRNKLWRAIFSLYSRFVIPTVGGMLSGERGAYEYLPKTAAAFPYGAAFEELLRTAGLQPITTTPLMGGVAYLYIAQRSV